MAGWVGNYIFQANWRKIDDLCPNFPKFLTSASHQCCSSMCRWVCCIPASLLQFSEVCGFIPPHTSHFSDVPEQRPGQVPLLVWWAACSICWLWASLRTCGQGRFSMWNPGPFICWLYPKQMDKAQDEGCSRGAMVPSQRLKERDTASWEKGIGKTEPLVCLIYPENCVLQKAEFYIAISNQTSRSPTNLGKIIKAA